MGFLSRATIVRELDTEWKALTTPRLVLDAAKLAAADLMRQYPDHALAGLAVSVIVALLNQNAAQMIWLGGL